MIYIFGSQIPLEDWLGMSMSPVLSFALTALVWIVIALALFIILSFLVRRITRRTRTEVDDVLLRVSRWPFIITVVAFGLTDALHVWQGDQATPQPLRQIFVTVIAATITYWVWRVFKEVLIYYGEEWAERTETNLDDVLIPIVNQLAPLVIFTIGGTFILQYWGVNLASILVAIGGVAFIAAFALQDSLSNIFSGISLLVDTPFKYGDLILLDGTVCVIEKIGLRVTQLYNTEEHSIIFMPNSQIANEQLINITRPTPALLASIPVPISRECDPATVIDILSDVAYAHPDVLGDIQTKIEAMQRKITRLEKQNRLEEIEVLVKEAARLSYENKVNDNIEALTESLDRLADQIEELETGGLSPGERMVISEGIALADQQVKELKQAITAWVMMQRLILVDLVCGQCDSVESIRDRVNQYQQAVSEAIQSRQIAIVGEIDIQHKERLATSRQLDTLVGQRGFKGIDRGIHDIDQRAEFLSIVRSWNKKGQLLDRRLKDVVAAMESGVERRLDDLVRGLRDWVYTEMKETTPEWKYPDVLFIAFGESTNDFALEIFIDDVTREHFDRQDRVITELHKDIVERLREANIDMPVPQRELSIRNGQPVIGR